MAFAGFHKETVRFLSALAKNNEKAWFEAHRADYEAHHVAPATELAAELLPRLQKLDRRIQGEPRVGGSIMRIFRDVRSL